MTKQSELLDQPADMTSRYKGKRTVVIEATVEESGSNYVVVGTPEVKLYEGAYWNAGKIKELMQAPTNAVDLEYYQIKWLEPVALVMAGWCKVPVAGRKFEEQARLLGYAASDIAKCREEVENE